MRRAVFALLVFALVGCGGGTPVATPTAAPTTTATPSPVAAPTVNSAATATRGAELAQNAILATTFAVPAATPTPLAPTKASVPPTDTPVPNTPTAIPATATTGPPTVIALPTTADGRVVTVVGDGSGQDVNIRSEPSTSATILTQVRPGVNLPLKSTTRVGREGADWWQIVSDQGGVAYVRADLVSVPHASSVTAPTIATSAGSSDPSAYAAYLQSKFGSYGNHKIDLQGVDINDFKVVQVGHAVTFQVSSSEALYIFKSARKSDLQAWGAALIAELKAHWPGQYVAGYMEYSSSTFTPSTKSDCYYVDYDNPSLDTGFSVIENFVKVSYLPSQGLCILGAEQQRV